MLKIEDYDRIEQAQKAKALLNQREIEYHSSQKLNKKGYGAVTVHGDKVIYKVNIKV